MEMKLTIWGNGKGFSIFVSPTLLYYLHNSDLYRFPGVSIYIFIVLHAKVSTYEWCESVTLCSLLEQTASPRFQQQLKHFGVISARSSMENRFVFVRSDVYVCSSRSRATVVLLTVSSTSMAGALTPVRGGPKDGSIRCCPHPHVRAFGLAPFSRSNLVILKLPQATLSWSGLV